MQQGPQGSLVSGTFKETETMAYQDEVGLGKSEAMPRTELFPSSWVQC